MVVAISILILRLSEVYLKKSNSRCETLLWFVYLYVDLRLN